MLAAHERYGTLLRVVFLIDEVDAVLDFPWTDKLLGMFRSLVYDSDVRAYVRMVFAGSGRYLHVDEKGSPLLNAVKACFLDPFDDMAIKDLIRWADNISPDVAAQVVQQGGGQPFILQHILHYLFDKGIETVSVDTVSAETRRFLHDRTQDIDNWWYAIGENGRKTYYLLAQSMIWMTHADMRESAHDPNLDLDQGLKALCFHGLVKHDGTYKKFCVSGQLFRDWALKKYQQIEEPKPNTGTQSGSGPKIDQKAGDNALQLGQISSSSITIYHGTTPEITHSFVGVNPKEVEKLRPIVTIITARFDREEFRTLCFNIGVNYDELTPGGLEAQAIQLVRSCDHSDYLDLLIQEIKRLRPSVNF